MNLETMSNQFITIAVIPWCIWVTVSLFNQRQQIALLKQEIELLKEIKKIMTSLSSEEK